MLRSALFVGAAASALAVGCVQTASTQCGKTGPVCPENWVCVEDLSACIDPAVTLCGNGVDTDPGEECDDGNLKNGDSCNWNCKLPACGDGLVNASIGEECDGATPGTSPAKAVDTPTCTKQCKASSCGDGYLNPNAVPPEQCELRYCSDKSTACETDANCAGIGDGTCAKRTMPCCSDSCQNPSCGDLITQPQCGSSPLEACDKGKFCADGTDCVDASDCAETVGSDKTCEPRDVVGCSHDCRSKEECGDNYPNDRPREIKTDHVLFQVGADGISLTKVEKGSTVTRPETCDDGNTKDGDSCSSDCLSKGECGDRYINDDAIHKEVCDDGKQCEKGGKQCNDPSDCVGIGDGQCKTRDGDGCSADCASNEQCGNHETEAGEECDEGMHCGDGTACTCTNLEELLLKNQLGTGCSGANAPECTGKPDGGVCKPRNPLPAADGTVTGCSAACTLIICGNGRPDEIGGEECDDDNLGKFGTDGPHVNNEDDCKNNCRWNVCGDGVKNMAGIEHGLSKQQCDDGKDGIRKDTANCDSDCTPVVCGDGYINYNANETCELKDGASQVETKDCDNDCTFPFCGDNHINPFLNEVCDDGNQDDDDGCAANCKSEEVCGDGVTNKNVTKITLANGDAFKLPNGTTYEGPEICDPGALCSDGTTPCTMKATDCGGVAGACVPLKGHGCSDTCYTTEVCGDSKLTNYTHVKGEVSWPAETCDDGNARADDGCSAKCELESGWSCATLGQPCSAVCGDGLVVGPESCDEGINPPSGGCSASCAKIDGWSCPAVATADSNAKTGGLCTPICGDRIIRGSENCDDGNKNSGDGCDASCHKEAGWVCQQEGINGGSCASTCGDSLVVGTEECDDGHNAQGVPVSNDGCDSTCRTETGWACPATNGVGGPCTAVCGDGIVRGGESCDEGSNLPSGGCTTCHKVAGWDCPTAPGGLCRAHCGDGVVIAGIETCDDGDTAAGDGCNGLCQVEEGWTCPPNGGNCAPTCGDGLLRGTETCDEGAHPATAGCIACVKQPNWICATVGELCVPNCGDGVKVGNEECDDGVNNSRFGDCTLSCVKATCTDAYQHSQTLVVGGPIETDLNCGAGAGGPAVCPKCASGKRCIQNSDCLTNFCNPVGNTCQVPTRVADEVRMHVNGPDTLVFDVSYLLQNDEYYRQTDAYSFSVSSATCGSITYDSSAATLTFDRNGGTPCEAPATTPARLYTSTFTYTVCPPAPNDHNPALCSSPTTVTVVINRDPVLAFTASCVAVGTASTSVNVLGAFTDPDTNPLDTASIVPTSADAGVAAARGSVVTWTPSDAKVPGEYTVSIQACDNVSNDPFPAGGCTEANWIVRWSEAPHLVSISDSAAYPIVVDDTKSIAAYTGPDRIITDDPTAEVAITVAKFANGPFSTVASAADRGTCTLVDPSDLVYGDESIRFDAPADPANDSCFVQVCEVCSGIQICSVTRIPFKVIDAPVANDDEVHALSGPPATGTIESAVLLSNDLNAAGANFEVLDGGVTSCGGTVSGSSSLTYTGPLAPVGGCLSTDTFTYQLCSADIPTLCDVATATITIGRYPDAVADLASTNEDTVLTISAATLLANDTDPDHDPLTITSVSGATNGTVTLSGTTITFTPGPSNFNGAAGFVYTVSDGTGLTDTTAVTVTVVPVNDTPVMTSAPTSTVAENASNTTIVYQATATDVDAADTIAWSLTGADKDAFTIDTLGAVRLTVSANFEAKSVYNFNVVATDTGLATATQGVTLNITNVNEAPTVTSLGTGTVPENSPTSTVTYTATASDPDAGDTITWSLTGTDADSFVIATNGSLTLKASANFEAKSSYSLNVVATDSGALTNTRAIIVSVTDVNDPPVAVPDTVSTNEDTPLLIVPPTITGNDTDADLPAQSLQLIGVGGALNGSLSFAGVGVTFTPNANFNGAGGFTYTISDQNGGLATGTVTVTVNPVNDAPVLDNSKTPVLAAVNENAPAPSGAVGTLVSSLVDFSSPSGQVDNVSDVDSGALLGIAVTAADVTNGSWLYTIDGGTNWLALGAVTNTGARLLAADANTRLYFLPNPTFNGSANITFRAWDRSSGVNGASGVDTSTNGATTAFSAVTDTASTTVDAVNDAPVLDNTKSPVFAAVNEDAAAPSGVVGTLISALVDIGGSLSNVTDVDGTLTVGIAITAADTANGSWFYSTNNGTSWTALGAVTNTSARLLAADANTRLYFQPTANFNGTATITFRAWDRSLGANADSGVNTSTNGGTTPYSTATDTASQTVTAVNDAPVLDSSKSPVLTAENEDVGAPSGAVGTLVSGLVDIGGALGNVSDIDATPLAGMAITTTDSANGTWHFSTNNGTSWSPLGAVTASSARLLAADANTRLYFQPNANFNGTATVTFRAWDRTTGANGDSGVDTTTSGGTTAFSTVTDTASQTVTAVNDAPVLDNSKTPTLVSETEDAPAPSGVVGTLVSSLVDNGGALSNVSDVDSTPLLGLAVTAADTGNGSWHYSTNGGTSWLALGAVTNTTARLLVADANTRIYFQPSANYNGTATITFRAWDRTTGANGGSVDTSTNGGTTAFSTATDTAAVTVTGVNDAPTLATAPSPALNTVLKNSPAPAGAVGTLVSDLADIGGPLSNVTDPDASALVGIAITAADTNHGSWHYSIDGGTTWSALGAVSSSTARLLAADASTRIYFQPNFNYSNTLDPGITFRAWDRTTGVNGGTANPGAGGGSTAYSSATDTASVTVDNTNTQPVLDNTKTPVLAAEDEDAGAPVGAVGTLVSSLVDIGGALSNVTDTDVGAETGIALSAVAAGGSWFYSTNGGTNWTAVPSVNSNSALLLAADTNTRIYCQPTAGFNGTISNAITFYAWDRSTGANGATADPTPGGSNIAFSAATDTANLVITAVNDAPTATIVPTSYSATEQVSLTLAGTGLSVADVDAASGSVTVTVSVNAGTISATAGTSGAGVAGSGTASATLTGTLTQVNALMAGTGGATLSYINSSDNPPASATLTLQVDDGGNTGTGGALTGSDTAVINITAVNDAPVNTVPGAQSGAQDTPIPITGLSVNDPDANLSTVALAVTQGSLTVSLVGGATVSAGANGTNSVTLSGTQVQINAALATLTYQGSLHYNGPDTLTVTSTDAGAATDIDTVGITVTFVNSAPVNSVPGAQNVAEDAPLSVTGISVSDVDSNLSTVGLGVTHGTLTVSLAGGATISAGANGSGALTLSGTQVQINAALGTLSYQGTLNYNGSDTLTVTATDSSAATDVDTVGITVIAVNDAPANTVPGSQSIAEDTALSVSGVSVNDVDGNLSSVGLSVTQGTLTVTLGGGATISAGSSGSSALTLSGTQVQINAALGTLSYQGTLNYNGADTLTVTATDSNAATDVDTVGITVTAVNDSPVNTVPGAQNVAEDTALPITGISVNDVDGNISTVALGVTQGTLSVSLSGGATISAGANGSGALTLSGTQGQINAALATASYQGALNYNGADTLTVTATDGAAATDVDTVAITVTAVNDAPVNTVPGAQSVAEDSALPVSGVSVNDVDGNISTVGLGVTQGTLTVSLSGGATISAGTNGTGALTLSGTQIQINAALGTLSYQGTLNYNGSDTLTVTATDASSATDVDTVGITVTAVNDAPVNTVPGAQSVAEDTGLSVTGISVNDVDGNISTVGLGVTQGTLTVSLAGGATISAGASGSNALTLSGTQVQINAALGTLAYQGTLNYNGSDTLTVTSTDGAAATDVDTVGITVTPVNDAPVNTVPGAQSVAEDTALPISGISVTDVDPNLTTVGVGVTQGTLTVSLTGGATISAGANGSGAFTLSGTQVQINAALATLSYQGTSNYNGSDTLTVTATDGSAATDVDTIGITVNPVNDAPVLDAGQSPPNIASGAAPVGSVGTLVSSLVDTALPAGGVDNVTDVDTGALVGIAITAAADGGFGTWWYSTNSGGTWTAVGGVSDSSALQLAANGSTQLYFERTASGVATITIRAWDQSSGTAGTSGDTSTNGGITPFSSATDTVSATNP